MKRILLAITVIMFSVNVIQAQKSNAVWYVLEQESTSHLEDDAIRVIFNTYTDFPNDNYNCGPRPNIKISVYNKTDQVIFIDKLTSSILRNKGAFPLYVPMSTSETEGKGAGISVNAGAISDVIGVGGAIGKIAHGTTVGANTSSGGIKTVYSQRIIAIPPHGQSEIANEEIFIPNSSNYFDNVFYYKKVLFSPVCTVSPKYKDLRSGEIITYEESKTKFTLGGYISYSFTEDFSERKSIETSYYVKHLIGTKRSFSSEKKEFGIINSVFPNWSDEKYKVIRLWCF